MTRALNITFYRGYSNAAENCVVPFDGDEYLKKKVSGHMSHKVLTFLKQGITLMRDVRDFFFY
jgi:hypothetical protein